MMADDQGAADGKHSPRIVGTKAKRIEDRALLRGRGKFLDDIHIDGVLHAAFLRSQHAHARFASSTSPRHARRPVSWRFSMRKPCVPN